MSQVKETGVEQKSTTAPATIETPKDTEFSVNNNVSVSVDSLEKAQAGEISISLNYHEFDQDVPIRGIFLGVKAHTVKDQTTGELKTIPGAVFLTAKQTRQGLVKEARINCSCKFVEALRTQPVGFAFEAIMTGRKQKGDKSIAQFHIVKLTPNQ